MNRIINNRKIDTIKNIIESEDIPIDTTQYKKSKTEKNKMNRPGVICEIHICIIIQIEE